jgi:hypothetical protein
VVLVVVVMVVMVVVVMVMVAAAVMALKGLLPTVDAPGSLGPQRAQQRQLPCLR